VIQLHPVAVESGQRREPGPAPPEGGLIGAGLGRRTVVGTGAGDGAQARVAGAPEAQPVTDQIAEGEQDRVQPL
jgi:hypothetical protein